MKLQKRDIAEALGLVYQGKINNQPAITGLGCYEVHYFQFEDKNLYCGGWYSEDEAWDGVSDLLLKPFIELLKGKL